MIHREGQSMVELILGAAASVKVAYTSVGVLAASAGGWAYSLLAQETATATSASTLIPAAALTGTSGALVWVVKQIVGGNLVHRDPAVATTQLAAALDRMNDIAEKGHAREEILTDLLRANQGGPQHGG